MRIQCRLLLMGIASLITTPAYAHDASAVTKGRLHPSTEGCLPQVLSKNLRTGLHMFYKLMNGDGWNDNTGWETQTCPCGKKGDGGTADQLPWRGVTCRQRNTEHDVGEPLPDECGDMVITCLRLPHNNLIGDITDWRFGCPFRHLRTLDLSSNINTTNGQSIKGDLSYEMLTFKPKGSTKVYSFPIQYLYLQMNELSGDFTEFLNICSKTVSKCSFQNLALASNHLTGQIGDGIAHFIDLTLLLINNNLLTGHISPKVGELTELVIFDASSNALTGPLPEKLSSLPVLYTINLAHNRLSGTLPKEWQLVVRHHRRDNSGYNSGYLHTVNDGHVHNLYPNGGKGSLQPLASHNEGKTYLQLESVFLQNNSFSGSIPNLAGRLVDLSANNFSGHIPNLDWACESSAGAKLLNFSSNPYLKGPIPDGFAIVEHTTKEHRQCGIMVCGNDKQRLTGLDIITDKSYNSSLVCRCQPGYFGIDDKYPCYTCDWSYAGCLCEADTVQNCYPFFKPAPNENDILTVMDCPLQEAGATCGPNKNVSFKKGEAYLRQHWCKEGYTDHLCSRCITHYYRMGKMCIKCSQWSRYFYPMILLLFSLLVIVTMLVVSGENITGLMKIFIFYVQLIAVLFADRFGLSNGANMVLLVLSRTTILSFTSAHLECFWDVGPVEKLLIDMMMPFLFCMLMLVIYLIGRLCQRKKGAEEGEEFLNLGQQTEPQRGEGWKDRCINVLISISLLYYFPCAYSISRALSCSVGIYDLPSPLLNSDPWITCSFDDPHFTSLFLIAVPFCSLYLFLFPFLLFRYTQLNVVKRRLLEEESPAGISFRTRSAMVVGSYKPRMWFWEYIVFVRRIGLAVALAAPSFNSASWVQYAPPQMIITISMLLQYRFWPYTRNLTNRLEMITLGVTATSFTLAIAMNFVGKPIGVHELSTISAVVLVLNTPLVLSLLVVMVLIVVYFWRRDHASDTDSESQDEEGTPLNKSLSHIQAFNNSGQFGNNFGNFYGG